MLSDTIAQTVYAFYSSKGLWGRNPRPASSGGNSKPISFVGFQYTLELLVAIRTFVAYDRSNCAYAAGLRF